MSVGFAKPRNPEHIPEHSLWVVRKDSRTAEARTPMTPGGPELRIYYNGAFLRSEVCAMAATSVTWRKKQKGMAGAGVDELLSDLLFRRART